MAARGKLVSEVFALVANAPNDADRKKILKDHETPALLYVLRGAFCPQIQYDVPIPAEFQASSRPLGTDLSSLHAEARRLYVFQKDYDKITPRRKQELLVPILESVHNSEARVLVAVLKKQFVGLVNGLTAQMVQDVFPGLLDWKGTPWTPEDESDELEVVQNPQLTQVIEPAKVVANRQGRKDRLRN